jgi:hypothetical protein
VTETVDERHTRVADRETALFLDQNPLYGLRSAWRDGKASDGE